MSGNTLSRRWIGRFGDNSSLTLKYFKILSVVGLEFSGDLSSGIQFPNVAGTHAPATPDTKPLRMAGPLERPRARSRVADQWPTPRTVARRANTATQSADSSTSQAGSIPPPPDFAGAAVAVTVTDWEAVPPVPVQLSV